MKCCCATLLVCFLLSFAACEGSVHNDFVHNDPAVRQLTEEQRELLHETFDVVRENISEVKGTLKKLNCKALAEESDDCEANDRRLEELEDALFVLRGITLVDEQVQKMDLPDRDDSERKRRSAELDQLADEGLRKAQERGIDVHGANVAFPKAAKAPRKRSTPCTNPNPHYSLRAVQSGKTIEVSVGGSVGVIFSRSHSMGTVYGQYGEYGCITTSCTGVDTSINFGAGASEGYYYRFDDVSGKSWVGMFSAGCGPFSGSYGIIYSGSRKIGHVISFNVGLSSFPLSISYFSCSTSMTRGPSCIVSNESYEKTYSTGCGWLGWSRCKRSKTAYRKKVSC